MLCLGVLGGMLGPGGVEATRQSTRLGGVWTQMHLTWLGWKGVWVYVRIVFVFLCCEALHCWLGVGKGG